MLKHLGVNYRHCEMGCKEKEKNEYVIYVFVQMLLAFGLYFYAETFSQHMREIL